MEATNSLCKKVQNCIVLDVSYTYTMYSGNWLDILYYLFIPNLKIFNLLAEDFRDQIQINRSLRKKAIRRIIDRDRQNEPNLTLAIPWKILFKPLIKACI